MLFHTSNNERNTHNVVDPYLSHMFFQNLLMVEDLEKCEKNILFIHFTNLKLSFSLDYQKLSYTFFSLFQVWDNTQILGFASLEICALWLKDNQITFNF